MSEQEKAIALQIVRSALDVLLSIRDDSPVDKVEITKSQRTVDIPLGNRRSITVSLWDFNDKESA